MGLEVQTGKMTDARKSLAGQMNRQVGLLIPARIWGLGGQAGDFAGEIECEIVGEIEGELAGENTVEIAGEIEDEVDEIAGENGGEITGEIADASKYMPRRVRWTSRYKLTDVSRYLEWVNNRYKYFRRIIW